MILIIEAGFTGITILLICILSLIFVTGYNKKDLIRKEFYALGTLNQLSVYGNKTETAMQEAIEKVMEIETKMSVFKSDSEISRLNTFAGIKPQEVSDETYYVIQKAVEYCALSQGAFDITIRPLVALWGIGSGEEKIPSKEEIAEKLNYVNYKDILFTQEHNSILLKNKGQEIEVGGIAKGYAADEVKNVFIKNHIKSALLNLGGNVVALGRKLDGSPWCIGIQDPTSPRGNFVGTIAVSDKSIVTSGNYERYFMKDGKKFHHILDPITGSPSESEIISVTILSESSIDGDVISTGLYIMGIQKAMKLVEELKGVEAIFITTSKEIHMTSGIKGNFILTNPTFSVF